jgi:transcriptional regulator with XRE-family HTH domain
MIRNERQYRITTHQRKLLADALQELLDQGGTAHGLDEQAQLRFELQKASVEGRLSELDVQLKEYEQLRTGQLRRIRVTTLSELPIALVQARIAGGLSQRELAQRLGLKEQQIQRYEAEDYASASLSRLEDVRRALGVELEAGVEMPTGDSPLQRLKQRLVRLGLDRSVVEHRITGDIGDTVSPAKVLAVAERAARLLGLTVKQLLAPEDIQLPALATTARFKAPAHAAQGKLDAYTRYAEGLADIVLKATAHMPMPRVPASAQEARMAIDAWLADHYATTSGTAHDEVSSKALYEATLQYLFAHGVPVIALRDPGAFHGACFTADSRSVIVIKQTTDSVGRWLADILHESGHLSEATRGDLRTWVELGDIGTWSDDPEEQRANDFAADILFEGRAGPVLEISFQEAKGSIERLKAVVPHVAREAEVPVDVLANYLAYQLSRRGINWWPTAAGFQEAETPWRTATDILVQHLDFSALDSVEREVLLDALAT